MQNINGKKCEKHKQFKTSNVQYIWSKRTVLSSSYAKCDNSNYKTFQKRIFRNNKNC